MKRVAIIGAGPAGSAAAIALRRTAGVEVVLLERKTFPRAKACGSGLSPWALDTLDDLGLGRAIRAAAYPIRAALIGAGLGAPVELRSRYQAAIYLRSDFDMLLAREAARRGADLREGVRVDALARHAGRLVGVSTSDGDVEVDAAIVCNGATSTLAPAARPGRTLNAIMGWYEGVEGISDAVELYFDPVVKPYYGWLFPESPRRVNIGICYAPTDGGPNALERFETFVATRFGRRARHATRIGRLVGHPIATTYRPAALSQHGTLVAGEAGRLVDPVTAEGIHHAMATGLIAGEMLGDVLARGLEPTAERLAPHTARVRRRLGAGLWTGQALLAVTRTPVLDWALRFASTRSMKSVLTWALARA